MLSLQHVITIIENQKASYTNVEVLILYSYTIISRLKSYLKLATNQKEMTPKKADSITIVLYFNIAQHTIIAYLGYL